MLLADMGADVLVIDRPANTDLGLKRERWYDVMMRGKRSVTLDLKKKQSAEAALQLVTRADCLIEGMRPGVMERLGLGPDVALARNPKLVYGRMTGWGQDGPLAPRAGHDINYIALAGVLHAFGRKGEAPVPPLNLVGRLRRRRHAARLRRRLRAARGRALGPRPGGRRRDGGRRLAARAPCLPGFLKAEQLDAKQRGDNILDTGAPWYNVYETKDGKYVSIGSIETRFYEELLQKLGVPDLGQHDRKRWPEMQRALRQDIQIEKPRRVVPGVRRLGRLLRAGAFVVGGAARCAQCRAQVIYGSGKRGATVARATLLAHARRSTARTAGARRGRPASAGRLGIRS